MTNREKSSSSTDRSPANQGESSATTSNYPGKDPLDSPRSPQAQRALDARKETILRSMSQEQINTARQEIDKKINLILDEDRKKNGEIDREIEKLTAQRELERKLYWRQKERKGAKGSRGDTIMVKEEAEI